MARLLTSTCSSSLCSTCASHPLGFAELVNHIASINSSTTTQGCIARSPAPSAPAPKRVWKRLTARGSFVHALSLASRRSRRCSWIQGRIGANPSGPSDVYFMCARVRSQHDGTCANHKRFHAGVATIITDTPRFAHLSKERVALWACGIGFMCSVAFVTDIGAPPAPEVQGPIHVDVAASNVLWSCDNEYHRCFQPV